MIGSTACKNLSIVENLSGICIIILLHEHFLKFSINLFFYTISSKLVVLFEIFLLICLIHFFFHKLHFSHPLIQFFWKILNTFKCLLHEDLNFIISLFTTDLKTGAVQVERTLNEIWCIYILSIYKQYDINDNIVLSSI